MESTDPNTLTPTKLVYLEHNSQLSLLSQVKSITTENDQTCIVLDATVFYPQGGGQPYDQGRIENGKGTFKVNAVRFVDGIVKHYGLFERGFFTIGDSVVCHVDAERRSLHSRIHSAGHLIDMAVARLGFKWEPGKGFHFPEGPYIEYITSQHDIDIVALEQKLQQEIGAIITQAHPVSFIFMNKDELATVCAHVPDYLPVNKPTRVVLFGQFGIPCGGTHVEKLDELGEVKIRKIKVDNKKNIIKISYECK